MIEHHSLNQRHGKYSGDADMRLMLMAYATLDFAGCAPCDNTFVSHSEYDPDEPNQLSKGEHTFLDQMDIAFFSTFEAEYVRPCCYCGDTRYNPDGWECLGCGAV